MNLEKIMIGVGILVLFGLIIFLICWFKRKSSNGTSKVEVGSLPVQGNVLYTSYDNDRKYILEPLDNVLAKLTITGKFTGGWGENFDLIETTKDGTQFNLNPAMHIKNGYNEKGDIASSNSGTMELALKSTSTYELSRKNNEPFKIEITSLD